MLFLLSCSNQPTTTIKGKLSLVDGKPVISGKILYSKGSIKNDVTKKVDIPKGGEFSLTIKDRDEYKIIFAHHDYAPQTIFLDCYNYDLYEFNVTLNRYATPDTAKLAVVIELDNYDFKHPLKRNGNILSIDISTDKNRLKYQIFTGNRTINGDDKIVGCDDSGDFISEVQVVDGVAHIEFSYNPEYYADYEEYYGFENVHNAAFNIGEIKFRNLYRKWALILKEKVDVSDTTLNDLEPLFDEMRRIIGSSENRTDSLYFYSIFNRYLESWTDEYDREEEILAMWEDREFIAALPMNSAISYVRKIFPIEDDTDSTVIFTIKKKREEYFESLLNVDVSTSKKISILYSLRSYYEYSDPNESKREYWEKRLLDEYPKSYLAHNIRQEIEMNRMLENSAPGFTLPDRYGEEVSLSDFIGRYVLLDFWGKFCGPCIAEIPNMKKVYSELDKSAIEFVSICVDMEPEQLLEFTEEREMSWIHVSAPGWGSETAKKYYLSFVPHLLLIDPEGIIVQMDKGLRGEELLTTLQKYLD